MRLKALELVKRSTLKLDYRQAHPIVLNPKLLTTPDKREQHADDLMQEIGDSPILDVPFDMFTMEFPATELFDFVIQCEGETLMYISVHALLCNEVAVGSYQFLMLCTSSLDDQIKVLTSEGSERLMMDGIKMDGSQIADKYENRDFSKMVYAKCIDTTRTLLGIFHEGAKGCVKGQGSQGYKHHGRRKSYAPRDVIYIGSKEEKKFKARAAVTGEPVNWSHVWRVMAHWRKIGDGSLGVDRQGNRTQYGRTWIRPFTKGKGRLIEKTRVLK